MPNEKTDLWVSPPLSPEDERLVEAYLQVGRPVDHLPHTPDISKLVERLGQPDTEQHKHDVFLRLLRLRKTGRLPRVGMRASA